MSHFFVFFFKHCDIFGVPIQFSLNKKSRQKSTFGGILSFLLFGIISAIAYQILVDLANRTNFTSYTQDIYNQEAPELNLESYKLNIALSFNDKRMNNGSYFKLELYQAFTNYTNGTNYGRNRIQLKTEKCTIDHFREDLQKQFLQLDTISNLNTFICPMKDQQFYVQGGLLSNYFSYFYIRISACQNTSDVICVSDDEIDNIFSKNSNKIYLDVYISNNLVNANDFNNPVFSYFSDNIYVLLDRDYYKEKNYYLTQNKIITDSDLLSTNFQEQTNTYTYEKIYEEDDVRLKTINNSTTFSALYFRSDTITKEHYRTSEKLGKYISYLGGFWSVLYFAFGIIGKYYNTQRLAIKLANALYDFTDGKQKKFSFFAKFIKTLSKPKPKYERGNGSSIIKFDLEKKLENYLEKNKKFKLPYDELFFLKLFRSKNNERKQIYKTLREKAKKAIENDLDIVYLLTKIKSAEKFKEMMLTKDQSYVFQFFPKTQISPQSEIKRTNQSKISRILLSKFKSFMEKESKEQQIIINNYLLLFQSYQNLKNEENNKNLNQKIMELIKPEIKLLFEEEEENHKSTEIPVSSIINTELFKKKIFISFKNNLNTGSTPLIIEKSII